MKYIVNKCFGGFGLSNLAKKELVLRDAKCIKSTKPEKYCGSDWKEKWAKDFPSEYIEIGDGFWGHKWDFHIVKDNVIYDYEEGDYDTKENRADKDLIEVVEKLGKEANGQHASLKIINIPDGIKIEWSEYDGVESIHEKHHSW